MKLKRILAIFMATLTLLLAAPSLAASFHSEVRVRLSIGSKKELTITPVGEFYVKEAPELTVGTDELKVKAVGSRVELTVGGKTLTAAQLTLMSRDYGGRTAYIRLRNSEHGTCTYLGNMTFDIDKGCVRAINQLPMEQYLYGVIPNEMSNSFPIDALMAQAVCARSYAMAKCSNYATRSYDLGDTSNDQVYCGFASKNVRAIAAVDATAGKVLTYDGDVIEAFYSSSNGGQTERTSNVWDEDYPYYVNVDDPYDLKNASSMEYFAFIPREYNKSTISAMDREVYSLLLKGACEAAGEDVTLLGTVSVKPHSSDYTEPSRCYLLADVTLEVEKADKSAGQVTVTLTLKELLFDSAQNTTGAFGAKTYTLRMRGAERAEKTVAGTDYSGWNLTMRRYGHGVGLSQRGAQQRARDGQGYADILSFYYVDTRLNTVGTWQSAPRLSSDDYRVNEWGVSGIKPNTKANELLDALKSDGSLTIVTSKGRLKETGGVTTGDFVRTSYDEGNSMFDLPIIVYGDLDGESGVTQADADVLQNYLIRSRILTGPYYEAADVNHDGKVDASDLVYLVRSLCGDETISRKRGS